jgi:hypothetical protein
MLHLLLPKIVLYTFPFIVNRHNPAVPGPLQRLMEISIIALIFGGNIKLAVTWERALE